MHYFAQVICGKLRYFTKDHHGITVISNLQDAVKNKCINDK